MAQELSDKIRAAAQAKGIDPDTALRIARAESSLSPSAQAKTSSAGGLFQVVDKTWKEFGGAPGKKLDADENIRVGTDIIAKNAQTLKAFLQRDPRPAELYAAHYFGPTGARNFLSADPATPIVDILGKAVVKANPNLRGKNVGQVLAQLETKMGGKPAPAAAPAQQASVPRETPPQKFLEADSLETSPPAAAAPATGMREQVASLGPGYQAALALSFLADTDEKEDRDVEKEPGIAEKWLAQTASRPAAMAQFSDIKIRSPFQDEPEQPLMLADGGEVTDPEAALFAGRGDVPAKPNMTGRELAQQLMLGVGELPYLYGGAPVDLAALALSPFGYKEEKPFLGSEYLKDKATKLGIRAPDTKEDRLKGPRVAAEMLSSLTNPAGATRSAVLAAEKGARGAGTAAKMLEDVTVGNIQRGQVRRAGAQAENIPDTAYDPLRERLGASGNLAYAVRPRGTPFIMERGPISPAGNFQPMDQAENYVRQSLATTQDAKLNDWFSTRMLNYLRRDFASPEDQFVKAADEGKLLHMAKKPTKRDQEDVLDYSQREGLKYTRETEGFPAQGMAATPYGQRVESLVDVSVNPATLEDLIPSQVPPSMRNMVETDPAARVSDLASTPEETLQLRALRDDMLRMRQLGPEYSAYGQAPVKVPKEYLLTDESLVGLTPAQASNRVATFRNWEQDVKEKMASKFMNDDPNIDRQELAGGYKAAVLPDLANAPAYKQLAMDVGCDGGWCTRSEQTALDYGSGDNRLHMIMDNRARPMAQLTLSQINPTPGQLAKDPGARIRFSVTELKGKNNSTDFENNPALPAIQQHIRSLDKEYDLRYVADLKSLGMKELDPGALVTGAGKLSALRNRFRPGITAEEYEAAARPDLTELQAVVRQLNEGSKYVTKDRDTDMLVQEALKMLAPQKRANGGMIERQSTDSRKYL